jgi:nanoRNase/pAp phosphatase (c-di-AMP/oligoRNAs hydrolase)
MRFSTRSHTGFDCAAFAQARGGGGHTAAAGFAVALTPADPQPFAMVRRLFS